MNRKREIWEELTETCDINTVMLIGELIEIDRKKYEDILKKIYE